MNKLKQKTLANIFPHYPYKKRHKKNTTRPLTSGWEYKEDHELSLNWNEWKILILIYLELLGDFLLSGMSINLPNRMGVIQLYKYKYPENKIRPDFGRWQKTGQWIPFKNNHTNAYGPILKWHRRNKQAYFARKWFWMLRLNRAYKKKMSKAIKDNPSLLFSYNDTSRQTQ